MSIIEIVENQINEIVDVPKPNYIAPLNSLPIFTKLQNLSRLSDSIKMIEDKDSGMIRIYGITEQDMITLQSPKLPVVVAAYVGNISDNNTVIKGSQFYTENVSSYQKLFALYHTKRLERLSAEAIKLRTTSEEDYGPDLRTRNREQVAKAEELMKFLGDAQVLPPTDEELDRILQVI